MKSTYSIAARILVGALAFGAHAVSAQQGTDTQGDQSDAPAAGAPAVPPIAPGAPTPRSGPPTGSPGARGAGAVSAVPRAGEVLLNFQSADLQAVVKAMSQMTGRNMLVDPRVRGQVTIVSARPMPIAAAYQVFLSALKAQGFTAVEGPGDAVRIVPVAE